VEKLSKRDLRSPDAFISFTQRILAKLNEHRGAILAFFAIVIVGGAVWAGFGAYRHSKEEKAQAVLFVAEKKLKAIEDSFARAALPDNKLPQAMKQTMTGTKPTGDMEADYKDALQGLREVVEKYPGTQAYVVASLNLAEIYTTHGKFDQGIPLLEKASGTARHPVTKGFVWNQLGLAYQGKGDCNKAIEYWQRINAEKELGFLHGASLVRTGLCYESLKQFDKAEQAYHKAGSLADDSDASRTAKKYLKLLKQGQNS
jgi:tetratricopeptide (TPR) repeat protein